MFPQCFATLSVVFIVEHLHHFLLYNRWRHYTSTIGLKFCEIPKKSLTAVVALFWFALKEHCKPKPCKAYRKLPVSQFSQEKNLFSIQGTLFSLQGSCFHYREFPVYPCIFLYAIAVSHSGISISFKFLKFFRKILYGPQMIEK